MTSPLLALDVCLLDAFA
ncbi:DUF645 family protein [Vibrio cholerae]|nr:DUF645 family protein [Vibrio cholerae]